MFFALAYTSLVLTVLIAGLAMWVWLLPRIIRGEEIIPYTPRPLAPWGLADLILIFVLLVFVGVFSAALFPIRTESETALAAVSSAQVTTGEQATKTDDPLQTLTLPEARQLVAMDCAIKIIAAVLAIAVMGLRLRPSLAEWGVTLQSWRTDLLLGAGTFVAMYMPTIGLQLLLVNGLGWKYEHPIIELATDSKDVTFFVLAFVSAVVLAPLFEEFVFRGLLQSWLAKLFAGTASVESILLGGRNRTTQEIVLVQDQTPTGESVSQFEPVNPNPYASPTFLNEQAIKPTADDGNSGLGWLSIVGSTVVFSLMHYSHGPAWIPLLIFGAIVGYVYQQTNRLWPGIIAHFLLNGLTMLGLWVQVFATPLK